MTPLLYDKTGTIKLGELTNCIECLVEEERNGLFEVSLIYPTNDTLFNSLEEENIIVCNANDTLLNQKFRIYMTRKLMSNRIEVFARHISFDLAYDYIDSIDIENQSCEHTLNTIFRNSQFSTHYKGYSDIINAQDYKVSKVNCIEAIGGTSGSILDTFGTGAEILRDNTNIHVLNKRGHDNGVSIEYAKNLTGFELEEDYSELITRIIPFAAYSDSEINEEILVEANAVDSDLISNYSHPYISYIDFSEKFEDEEIPTTSKLTELAKKYFKENECDKPKQNFKIEFVPLSKCVGYEGIQDNISLCDTVIIKDTRYNINTKAKVIKTVFDVLKNRYESMELGEPRTTLGDIINSSSGGQDGEQGPPGPQGPPGADGNIGDFPNSLPSTPILSANVYGFASIELNWTYENKVYYSYELYASKIKDFTPNEFDLIHAGQTSSYLFQAKPNETWYFRVRATNTHGESTNFSSQIIVNTTKVDDLSNYVGEASIGSALIGSLNADVINSGTIKGNYIDAKQLSVTNGNGIRTLDIDSYGNVNLNVNSLQISSSNVATENYANNQANNSLNSAKTYANNVANTAQTNAINAGKDYTNTKITDAKAEIKVTTDNISQRVSSNEQTTQTNSQLLSQVSTGVNKVLFEMYSKTGQDGTEIVTIDDYLDATLLHTLLLDDFQMFGGMDYYLGKMTTHLYFNQNVTHEVQAYSDDGSSIYLNGTLVASMPTCTLTPVTLNFKQGWNKIVWVYNEGNGGDGYEFTPSIKTLGGLVHMNAYPVSGDIEQLQAINSTVKTTKNRVAEIITNLDSITSRVSATETTTINTQTQLNNLKIGGRNLIKNGSFKDSAPGKDVNTFNYWRVWGTPLICYFNQNIDPYNETGFIYIQNSDFSNYSHTGIHSNRIPVNQLKKGKEYTVSYYYLRENNVIPGNARLEFLNENCDTIVHNIVLSTQNLTPTMKPGDEYKTKVTFQMPSIDFAYLQIVFDHAGVVEGHNGGSILALIGQVQLEEGNKATEWKPSFEETEDSINNVNNNLTTNYSTTSQMNSTIEQKANQITSIVSESYSTKEEVKEATDSLKGRSKWLFEQYTNNQNIGTGNGTFPTLDHIKNEKLITSRLIDVLPGHTSELGNVYIGVYTTYLYYENDFDLHTSIISDDESTVYWNDVQIVQSLSCQETNFTISVKKGLNKIVIVHGEGGGGDGVSISEFGNFKVYGAYSSTVLANATGEMLNTLENNYATKSELNQTTTDLTIKFTESGGYNLIHNGHAYRDPQGDIPYWSNNGGSEFNTLDGALGGVRGNYFSLSMPQGMIYNDWIELKENTHYIYQAKVWAGNSFKGNNNVPLHYWFSTNAIDINAGSTIEFLDYDTTVTAPQTWTQIYIHFKTTQNVYMKPFIYGIDSSITPFYVSEIMLSESRVVQRYTPNNEEVYDGITKIDKNGITVTQSNAKTKTTMSVDGFAITRTDTNKDIFRVGSNGVLNLNGIFKCYKNDAYMTGPRLESSGAIMFGYNSDNSTSPVFASGLWTDQNMGYFSVGYTRADYTDENGCLWMSPQHDNKGGRLTFSRLVNGEVLTSNLYFQKDGTIDFNTSLRGANDTDDTYTYRFDSGVSTRALKCDNLRTYNIYPRYTGSSDIGSASMRYKDIFADSLSTTNNQLRLGTVTSTGAWETYGALNVNSKEGYVFPDKGTGQLSLGISSKRFHTIYLVNSPNVSSDKRVKTDIHYLDEPVEETNIIDSEVPRVERNMNITTQDMYNFIKDDLKLASYRYNVNLERGNTSTDYGFIAQDILYTKVGSEIVQLEDKTDLNSNLSYNQGNYVATLAGALQEAIKKIEQLEDRIKELES